MKNAGVKIVDMGSVAVNNVADFLQQAAQQNFHPDALISAPAYDAQLLELVGNADRLIAPSDHRTRQEATAWSSPAGGTASGSGSIRPPASTAAASTIRSPSES